MTDGEIEARVEKIITNETLTTEERQTLFLPYTQLYFCIHRERGEDMPSIFNGWNMMVVGLINKHNLRRH